MISKKELHQLQDFLRKSFHNETMRVGLDPRNTSAAVVQLGEARIGSIAVDDEDGDRSFAFEMKIPVGREVLQDYLRKRFENDKLKIVADRKSTRLNSSHIPLSRMPSSA